LKRESWKLPELKVGRYGMEEVRETIREEGVKGVECMVEFAKDHEEKGRWKGEGWGAGGEKEE